MSALNLIAQARYDGMCEGQINVSGTLMLRLADALEETQARVAELEGELEDERVSSGHAVELVRKEGEWRLNAAKAALKRDRMTRAKVKELQAQLDRATGDADRRLSRMSELKVQLSERSDSRVRELEEQLDRVTSDRVEMARELTGALEISKDGQELEVLVGKACGRIGLLRRRCESQKGLLDRAKSQAAEQETAHNEMRSAIQGQLTALQETCRGEAWSWVGDGSDDIDSMSDGMVVAITAGQLRKFELGWLPASSGDAKPMCPGYNGCPLPPVIQPDGSMGCSVCGHSFEDEATASSGEEQVKS